MGEIDGIQSGSLSSQPDPLVGLFREFLKPDCVIHDQETKGVYDRDGLSMYAEQPRLVVLPETKVQLKKVMEICSKHEVPVVARGAGTGLSAGAMPHPDGIVLSLSKFNRILDVDPLARTARLEPGVPNLKISEESEPLGLFYAPDPSSQIACTIGGNLAENSGGVNCLKYGLTVHNVSKVDFVTAEGEEVTVGSDALDSPGFDVLALLNGSEGLLGVATEITVRLLPIPPKVQLLVAAFDSVQGAGNAVGAVISHGIIPAGLEMMDNHAIVAAEDFCGAGYPREAKALLLCEVDGCVEEVEEQTAMIERLFRESGATSTAISKDEAERELLWKGRKSAFPAVGRIAPDYYCMDGTIPRGQLAHVLGQIEEMSEHYGLSVANVFHAGDGNLHPLILFDASVPGEFEKSEEFGARILELCVSVGGCITGEHGVGVEKIRQMAIQFTDSELAQFHAVKAAFDPKGTLNPGKGVPQLKYCQEYRSLSSSLRPNDQPTAVSATRK